MSHFNPAELRDPHGKWAREAAFRGITGSGLQVRVESDSVTARDDFENQAYERRHSDRPDFNQHTGVGYIRNALYSGHKVATIRNGDQIVGAVSYHEKKFDESSPPVTYISNLGSTGDAKGAGFGLVDHVMRVAASRGQAVYGYPTPAAFDFWKRIGWRPDPEGRGLDEYGMTASEVRRRVSESS